MRQADWASKKLEGVVDPRYDMVPPRLFVKALRDEQRAIKRMIQRVRGNRSGFGLEHMTAAQGYNAACDAFLTELRRLR